MSSLPYYGSIVRVRFSLAGTTEVDEDAYVNVTSGETFRNNIPLDGGVYDAHMGTGSPNYKCQTCFNNKHDCIGHPGRISLNYPVWNPTAVNDGKKWLRMICFKCGKVIIPASKYAHFPASVRFTEASKLARTTNIACVHCTALHPLIKKASKAEPLALLATIKENKRIISEKPIYPHKIARVLAKISDETILSLGKPLSSHPTAVILSSIQVPAVPIRPDIKKMGSGRSTNDDLTTMMQVIIKKNEAMPTVIQKPISEKLAKAIIEINNAYYDFVRAKGDNAMKSITMRLTGKMGRFRKNQLGKRVRKAARSTITCDVSMKIGEVGVPISFARSNQVEEIVQNYNKKRLMSYVQNGRKKYPGASKIIKHRTGASYDIGNIDIELENGDTVVRDIIDGDCAYFGRQPSLTLTSISNMTVRIMKDPTLMTLRMNVTSCVLFNADFDGDAMLLVFVSSAAARNEIMELASVSNWFVSHTTSSPMLGETEDAVVGIAELTRSAVRLDKYHAMLLFSNTLIYPTFETEPVSGRDCVTKMLKPTPINFTRPTEWYKPDLAPYLQYKPDEAFTEISQGVLTGLLDKKAIGKKSNGGVFHLIANEYGPKQALESMWDMQQLAINYILQSGFTIGILDLLISQEAKTEIDKIASDLMNKSRLITEELHHGEIIPPIGKTVEEFYEERQINVLRTLDDFTEPIVQSINPNTNNLFKMINFGSKGSNDNMFNMVSAIGQKLINGERIRQKFGYKRTLPYFPRFDTSPLSRGYITNSYLAGMTSSEYIFNAMAARFDLITKALSTSVTGEQNRKSIKNLESIVINNFRFAVKNQNIIQFMYGEDGLDPRYVSQVKFPTVTISDAAFANYKHEDFPAFFAAMSEDRDKYREIFLTIEKMNTNELMSDSRKMPVDVQRLINDVTKDFAADLREPSGADLKKMIKMVDNLCAELPYIMVNTTYKGQLPKILSCWLLNMLIRSYMHPKALHDKGMTVDILQLIINKIKIKYMLALVDPGTAVGIIAAQSFSEPLTQYMLDSHQRSAAGGTSKTGMIRAKEVLGAKSVAKSVDPSMLIPLHGVEEHQARDIANSIEMMKISRFVSRFQVFAERYGMPIHPEYKAEGAMIREFEAGNPLLSPPQDLSRWCIRFTMNKAMMILKNMSIESMVRKIRESYSDAFVVYSPENAEHCVIRVYMRTVMFNGAITKEDVIKVGNQMLDLIIRGVDGIFVTEVVEMIRNKIGDDGSIVRAKGFWGIRTIGTNMPGVCAARPDDALAIQTDAIQEMYNILGIEAARQKIISEMRAIVASCGYRHLSIYADEMCFTGRVTSIEARGLKTRETSNVLLRIGFSGPIATLEEAATGAMVDSVTGVTAPLLVGSVPQIGSIYNSFHINEAFVRENVKKPDDAIAALFD